MRNCVLDNIYYRTVLYQTTLVWTLTCVFTVCCINTFILDSLKAAQLLFLAPPSVKEAFSLLNDSWCCF